MTRAILIGSWRVRPATLLLGLAGLTLAAALLTPETVSTGGGLSSYSAGAGGARIAFELAQRMGWHATRREAPLDSSRTTDVPDVQVVIGPRDALGAQEVHRLLENVRRGGGLVFSVDAADEIGDSLGLRVRSREMPMFAADAATCFRDMPAGERQTRPFPPTVYELAWRRPPPGPVTALGESSRRGETTNYAIGFTLGRGRIATVSSADYFANDAMRTCQWGADVTVARALEYVRPEADGAPSIVFDEFHHGYGVHGGSVKAVTMFLSRTSSGRFLAQALVAAMILLLAAAPRPVAPREPERIARRSPLEHADALGHAYFDVRATRTGTARLVSGLRRRAARTTVAERNGGDAAFLDAIARRSPSLAPQVAVVRRALTEALPAREFTAVGEAVATIERELLTKPPVNT